MAKINLGDYMAYLQHKTEKNEEERLQKVFEKLDARPNPAPFRFSLRIDSGADQEEQLREIARNISKYK